MQDETGAGLTDLCSILTRVLSDNSDSDRWKLARLPSGTQQVPPAIDMTFAYSIML